MSIADKLINKSVELFGLTGSIDRAGYILPDGRMLNFNRHAYPSMNKDIGSPFLDHFNVVDAYYELMKKSPDDIVQDTDLPFETGEATEHFMMDTGAARVYPPLHWTGNRHRAHDNKGISVESFSPLTEAQIDTIVKEGHRLGTKEIDVDYYVNEGDKVVATLPFNTFELKRTKVFPAQGTPIQRAQQIMDRYKEG